MATSKKDHLESFHTYGLYPPTRTIELISTMSDAGSQDGINYSMAMSFVRNLHYLESISKQPITVLMNTLGGDCAEGYVIYDAIKASKCEITIIVIGQAYSMGCFLLQAAKKRIVRPNSTLMFHAGNGGVDRMSPYEAANRAEFDRKFMERMYKLVYNRINEKREKDGHAPMAWKTFENMNLKGRYLFAEEAVELGIADEIEETFDSK